ncbi:GreA/GreB family elongation factor [Muricauda sp. NFXS6]|uniref:GreA/GreB family elongation factor n=1 Tax=Allomuricauda sp. NFXS6 TaxID=2819094 RepID=UPI0032DE4612|tara:strand:+ start:37530 stop:38075 length:546 start_codon:yes stop_codon:yes gene_type:complete
MMAMYPLRFGGLLLESNDLLTIKKYLQQSLGLEDYFHVELLELLIENVQRAIIVDEKSMPSDVVRLNSRVTLESSTGWMKSFQLVPPDDADTEKAKYSVVSALGCSVIGLSKGDSIRYGMPGQAALFCIVEVDQSGLMADVETFGKNLMDALPTNPDVALYFGKKEERNSSDAIWVNLTQI